MASLWLFLVLVASIVVYIVLYTLLKNFIGGPNPLGAVPCINDKDGAWTIGFVRDVSPESIGSLVGNISHCKSDVDGKTTKCAHNNGNMHTRAITCEIASKKSHLGIKTSISYVADPFLVIPPPGGRSFGMSSYFKLGIIDDIEKQQTGEDQVLFSLYEMKNAERSKGEIGAAVSVDMGNNWRHLGTALTSVEHLSYPFIVFNQYGGDGLEDGEYVMLPQSNPIVGSFDGIFGVQRALVTKPSDFPFGWKHVSNKLSGKKFADASPIFWMGKWYIWITSILHGPTRYSLELYYIPESKDLARSRWIEHPSSPITTNMTIARMGGRPLVTDDGMLLRPAQDCSRSYGRQVLWVHIKKLSPTEYYEAVLDSYPAVNTLWPPREKSTAHYAKIALKVKPRIHHVDLQRHPRISGSKSEWIGLVDGEHFSALIQYEATDDYPNNRSDFTFKMQAPGNKVNQISEYFLVTWTLCLTALVIAIFYSLFKLIWSIKREYCDYSRSLDNREKRDPLKGYEQVDSLPTSRPSVDGKRKDLGMSLILECLKSVVSVVVLGHGRFYSQIKDIKLPIMVKGMVSGVLGVIDTCMTYIVSMCAAIVLIRLLSWDKLSGIPISSFAFENDPANKWSPKNESRSTPELGMPRHYRIHMDLLTAASADYYPRILNLIGSLHTFESKEEYGAGMLPPAIHVYDLGFTHAQRLELMCMESVILHEFNFTRYPKHVHQLSNYAWKIILISNHLKDISKQIMKSASKKRAAVLWVDGGLEVRGAFMEETYNAMSYFGHSCAFVGPIFNADLSNEDLNRGLQINQDFHYKGMLWAAGGFQGFVDDSPGHNLILKPALKCALQENCIGRAYTYDQGVFTRLIHRYGFSCQPRDKYMARLGWKFYQNPSVPNSIKVVARRARLPLQFPRRLQFNKSCELLPRSNWNDVVEKKISERYRDDLHKGTLFMKHADYKRNTEMARDIYWLGLIMSVEFVVLFLGFLFIVDHYKTLHFRKHMRNNLNNGRAMISKKIMPPLKPGYHLHRCILTIYLVYVGSVIYSGELLFLSDILGLKLL